MNKKIKTGLTFLGITGLILGIILIVSLTQESNIQIVGAYEVDIVECDDGLTCALLEDVSISQAIADYLETFPQVSFVEIYPTRVIIHLTIEDLGDAEVFKYTLGNLANQFKNYEDSTIPIVSQNLPFECVRDTETGLIIGLYYNSTLGGIMTIPLDPLCVGVD